MPINREMEKQIAVPSFNRILFSRKKELKIGLSLKSVMLGEGTRTLKKYIGMNDFM